MDVAGTNPNGGGGGGSSAGSAANGNNGAKHRPEPSGSHWRRCRRHRSHQFSRWWRRLISRRWRRDGAKTASSTQRNGGAGGGGKVVITISSTPPSFTAGNLVVERLGDGLNLTAVPVTTIDMDEFTTGGSPVQNIKITDSGANALIDGSAASDGGMTLSADGTLLCSRATIPTSHSVQVWPVRNPQLFRARLAR